MSMKFFCYKSLVRTTATPHMTGVALHALLSGMQSGGGVHQILDTLHTLISPVARSCYGGDFGTIHMQTTQTPNADPPPMAGLFGV
jgi:hypothetical protein